jgi:hypothetical protein
MATATTSSRLLRLRDLLIARARFAAENLDLEFSPAGEWELERRVALLLRQQGELLLADRRRLLAAERALEDLVEHAAATLREERTRVIGPHALVAAARAAGGPYGEGSARGQ